MMVTDVLTQKQALKVTDVLTHLGNRCPDICQLTLKLLLYCQHEVQEYADEDDDHDFSFMVLNEEDLPMLNDLGPPEETVQINIKADGIVQTLYRIVYPTEVLFIPTDISF